MSKSSQAFRTIREVADWLGVAAHVLRFWESKFPQIKPVKRAGGRRYYRPADMELVGGIKVLLHDRGMTIRGVQKMIREDGIGAITALSPPMDLDQGETIEGNLASDWTADAEADTAPADTDAPTPPEAEEEPAEAPARPEPAPEQEPEAPLLEAEPEASLPETEPAPEPRPDVQTAPEPAPHATPDPAPEAETAGPGAAPGAPSAPDPVVEHADASRTTAALARLSDRLAPHTALTASARARLRPALAALRDRMQADPPA
jgi:DNA-binding transcriptional MerR regulator